jgi:tRNA nucleotidyltransferase/poly(A) polymerase
MSDFTTPALPPPESLARWLNGQPLPPGGLYLVGGSVRDMLLGRALKDLDLVCKGAKEFAAALAQNRGARLVPLGQDHDPPSLRVVNIHDHDDFLDVTELAGPDIITDLARRDFTANAIALHLNDLALDEMLLIDPFNGHEDIQRGLLRRVGAASLAQDPTRILRGFRLRAQLGWTITPDTLSNMAAVASRLAEIPGERLAPELRLILECSNAGQTVREMAQAGVLQTLLPEMILLRGCKQNRYHHLDVFEHSLAALECCDALLQKPKDFFGALAANINQDLTGWRLAWLKLAVLLHDLGKPGTRGLHPRTGQATFYGHDALGAKLALQITSRLRLSCAESRYISNLIRHHLHLGALGVFSPGVFSPLTPKATTQHALLKARMRCLRRLGTDLIPLLLLYLADTQAALGPASTPEFRQTKFELALRLLQDSLESALRILSTPPLLCGHDLIAMGMQPGPDLGFVLKAVREAQDAGEIKDREQALNLARKIRLFDVDCGIA